MNIDKDIHLETSAMAVVVFGNKILSTWELIYGKEVLSLPKGHVEENESLIETAIRECFEETNVVITKQNFSRVLSPYNVEFTNHHNQLILKTIHPILFEVYNSGNPLSKEERVLSIQWMDIEEFIQKCSYDNIKKVVEEI